MARRGAVGRAGLEDRKRHGSDLVRRVSSAATIALDLRNVALKAA